MTTAIETIKRSLAELDAYVSGCSEEDAHRLIVETQNLAADLLSVASAAFERRAELQRALQEAV